VLQECAFNHRQKTLTKYFHMFYANFADKNLRCEFNLSKPKILFTFGETCPNLKARGRNFSQLRSSTGLRFKIDAQFPWQYSMPFSDRDRSLKQVRT
jgi:hypothetical protein